LTPNSSISGKSGLSLTLCRIYENIYGNCVKKDINF